MKTRLLLFALIFPLLTCCKKNEEELPGISEEDIKKEDIIGGWGAKEVNCYINHGAVPGVESMQKKMQANLEKWFLPSHIYITEDSIYYIETHERGYNYVKKSGGYAIKKDPTRIDISNEYLMCDQYAPYYLVKKEDGRLCLYLTKSETLELLKRNVDFKNVIGLVSNVIDDAQFEFFLEHDDISIYHDIDNGDFVHVDNYAK